MVNKGDPNRSEGFDGHESEINALQNSAVTQIGAAVAHLPKEIASQYVAGAMHTPAPVFGSIPNADYSVKRSAPQSKNPLSRTGSAIKTPPGGENG
jgi:hypothetical protein